MVDPLASLEAQVEALRDAVDSTREQQRFFVRRAGHDLAAPLRGLKSLTSFLREDVADDLTGESLELLDRIDGRVIQMERVVTSLVSYARSGDPETATVAVELFDLVDDAVIGASPPDGYSFSIDAAPGPVSLPPTAVGQCLERIIENAWHHSASTEGQVSIVASCEDGYVRFLVADDGPGIDDATQKRALDPFHAGPPPNPGLRQRPGMGLAIASTLAAAHGASLSIDRHHVAGTVVELRWPLLCPLPFS